MTESKTPILVVDNHPLMRQYLSDLLDRHGYLTRTAEDGLAALGLLEGFRPRVILVDLIMPNIDGATLCRVVRRLPEHKDCYLVVISAVAAEMREDPGTWAANAVMAKGPFKTMGPALLSLLDDASRRGFAGVQEGILGLEDLHAREITRELLVQNRHREQVLESLGEGIIEITAASRAVYANRAALSILGKNEEAVLSVRLEELVPGLARTRPDAPVEAPEDPVRIGDREVVVRITASRETAGSIVILSDVTEHRRMEARLQQAQRLEAVGTLAAGVAHDFNNILMAIQGNASMMQLDLTGSHPHHERLQDIERQIRNATRLTGQLLGYSRQGRYEIKPFDVNALVRATVETFGRTRKDITVRLGLSTEPTVVEGDTAQIEQVLLNLFLNAGDAMPAGGTLAVATWTVAHHEIASVVFRPKPGRYVTIEVRDTGVGMDEKIRGRLFEPFFTTKDRGHGTGLGLASAYGSVKGHGGFIDVESLPGKGSSFRVHLPLTAAAAPAPAPDVKANAKAEGRGRLILLVDDEEDIRCAIGDMLLALGFQVVYADGGEAAVEAFQRDRERISFVLLDVVMPGIGGAKVFRRLRDTDPAVKILLCSGYSVEEEANELLRIGASGLIRKPFTIEGLSDHIRRIFGE